MNTKYNGIQLNSEANHDSVLIRTGLVIIFANKETHKAKIYQQTNSRSLNK